MKQAVLPCLLGHVFDDVFVNHHRVGRFDQRVEAVINFRLAGGGDFMVLALDLDAEFLHHQAHLGADVLLRVGGRDREITFLVADLVAEVRHFIAAGVPDGFLGIHAVEGAVALGIELHVVEDEELGFRPEHGRVGQPGADANISRRVARCRADRGCRLPSCRFRRWCRSSDSVGTAQKGSMKAVSGRAWRACRRLQCSSIRGWRSHQSQSLLRRLPRSIRRWDKLKCCQVPKVSTNLMSTILAPLFLAISITLFGVLMLRTLVILGSIAQESPESVKRKGNRLTI